MRRLGLAVVLMGCFGGGPTPRAGDDVTVAFAIPDTGDCWPSSYLGPIAFTGGSGAVALLPARNTGDPCGMSGSGSVSFVTFALDGDDANIVTSSSALGADTYTNSVGWAGDVPFFVYGRGDDGSGLEEQLGGGNRFVATPGIGVSDSPTNIVGDSSAVYFAIWDPGGISYDDPGFPFGASALSQDIGGGLVVIPAPFDGSGSFVVSITTGPGLCGGMPDCLTANSTTLFLMASGSASGEPSNGPFVIVQVPKSVDAQGSGTAATVFTAIPQNTVGDNLLGATGLAADDAHVAWALAADAGSGDIGCMVFAADADSGSSAQLLATKSFSCDGAAIDSSGVYFAITQPIQAEGGEGIAGLGVGRIGFDGTFSSIATHIPSVYADVSGPRRVYVVNDSLVMVDPHAVGVIPVTAFDGRDDIPR
jgi:hypothetical protein